MGWGKGGETGLARLQINTRIRVLGHPGHPSRHFMCCLHQLFLSSQCPTVERPPQTVRHQQISTRLDFRDPDQVFFIVDVVMWRLVSMKKKQRCAYCVLNFFFKEIVNYELHSIQATARPALLSFQKWGWKQETSNRGYACAVKQRGTDAINVLSSKRCFKCLWSHHAFECL